MQTAGTMLSLPIFVLTLHESQKGTDWFYTQRENLSHLKKKGSAAFSICIYLHKQQTMRSHSVPLF